ncbi:PI-PLC X domain-containing protein 1 isoform X2 [Orussus abietinus]|uniref:PI-PLC X domain-containing protein 1 isoform X2 n=1 Tax=Orussus abietinus TaxID=222816 RepID=UPI000624FB69|nr:PI-PLC X domain-containing protein 1 isoform X2 [Orussus abietinus]
MLKHALGYAMRPGPNLFSITIILFLVKDSLSRSVESADYDFEEAHVGLIISPVVSSNEVRQIEVYWRNPNFRSGDVIALFASDPSENVQPLWTYTPKTRNGIQKTRIEADFMPTENLTFQQQCLTHYVAWLRNGIIKKTNCLKTRPNWMHDRRHFLGPLRIRDVFLPGTHDSVAYSKIPGSIYDTLVTKYVITQDEDILSQLIYGVRYLDIRVGHYPNTEELWWGNHGFVQIRPLQTVINDVKTFLANTQEIVIFDIHEFPIGFGKNLSIHHKLVNYLEKELDEYIIPKSYGWSSNLDKIWSSGRKLIIGYDLQAIVATRNSVWTCVTHQWGNVRTVGDLYAHLNKIEARALRFINTVPRSAMAELTPNTWDVILDRLGGLRKMAEEININITTWYSTQWQHSANIVAVDFIKGSGIIETAIEWNEKRYQFAGNSTISPVRI